MPAAVRTRPDACPGVFAPHDAADGALARIRLPGGAIDAAALRAVADCADELGDGHLHLTSRGNLQLRGLSRSGALESRLTAAGLLPSVTHERVRNVLASPLAGIAGDPVERADVVASATVGGGRGPGSRGGDRLPRVEVADPGAVCTRATGSPGAVRDGDPQPRVEVAAEGAVDTRRTGSWDVRGLALELDRGLCARPALAALPGRFLFALDDGRGDVAAESPDLCWQAPDRLLVAGIDTGLRVPATDAVGVLLDAAEAFLALRVADGGGAWRAAELTDAPTRISAALAGREGELSRSWKPTRVGRPGLQHGGLASVRLQQSHHAAIPRTLPRAAVPGAVVRDDGGAALVVAPLLGTLTSTQARLLADAGPTAVVTPWRTIVLPDPAVPVAALAAAGLVVAPGPAADVSACAGRPGCAKALADVRADVLAAIGHLPTGRVHVSGCARRCGAPRTAHVDAVARAEGGYLVDGVPHPGLLP